jgi:hypothetical protein
VETVVSDDEIEVKTRSKTLEATTGIRPEAHLDWKPYLFMIEGVTLCGDGAVKQKAPEFTPC